MLPTFWTQPGQVLWVGVEAFWAAGVLLRYCLFLWACPCKMQLDCISVWHLIGTVAATVAYC
jgi:hypothetical protein